MDVQIYRTGRGSAGLRPTTADLTDEARAFLEWWMDTFQNTPVPAEDVRAVVEAAHQAREHTEERPYDEQGAYGPCSSVTCCACACVDQRIEELEDALKVAVHTIYAWHGEIAWPQYQASAEMQKINAALALVES